MQQRLMALVFGAALVVSLGVALVGGPRRGDGEARAAAHVQPMDLTTPAEPKAMAGCPQAGGCGMSGSCGKSGSCGMDEGQAVAAPAPSEAPEPSAALERSPAAAQPVTP